MRANKVNHAYSKAGVTILVVRYQPDHFAGQLQKEIPSSHKKKYEKLGTTKHSKHSNSSS